VIVAKQPQSVAAVATMRAFICQPIWLTLKNLVVQ
jgi:hypothetical protein